MTPDQQAIIDQLRAAAAEWRNRTEDVAVAAAQARLDGATDEEIAKTIEEAQ